jgi:hypothetical protein
MLCLACGAEMRLVQVVENTTMLVSGYEHQTWQCSGCSGVEERTAFSRKKRQTHRALVEPVSAEPTQTATDELTQIEPAELAPMEQAPVAPIQVEQPARVELNHTAPLETTVSLEVTDEPEPPKANPLQMPAATLQASILPKTIDERLQYLAKRATALREAAAQNKRRAQFDRDWDNLRSVRPPFGSSKTSRQKDRNEPVRSPAAPVAAQLPAPNEEPTAPERARGWNWRRLLSLRRQKSSLG